MTATKDERLQEVGASALASIREMVAALECDYDRLEELRELKAECEGHLAAGSDPALYAMAKADAQELTELEEAAGDCESREDAEQRIHEDALSVEVRTDWHAVGDEDTKPTHFNILLCTGGPAARIIGELNEYGEPTRAWLEYQDWGTPWTQYFDADQDTLLTYARCFYFGE